MKQVAVVLVLSTALYGQEANAQASVKQSTPPGSVQTVVPGEQYKAGPIHRLFLGTHHRTLWTTPLQAEVLDLSTFAGGLTPLKLGGGMQTRSLRLRGADGKAYVFRSLDKDPSKNISAELRETIAARVLQDQISSILPMAALAVDELMASAAILHAPARVVIMPDDERLGEFRAEFGSVLGLIEERPEADGEAGFGGANEIVSSEKMLERTENSMRDRADARAYLTARLLDVFVGDFDRHPDQWRWAGFADATGTTWQPIPRDRDFAFARMDGILPAFASNRYPQMLTFKAEYPAIWRLTWSGRALDRRLLVGLERKTWDSIASALQQRLTNDRIDAALSKLPTEYPEALRAELRGNLRQRRDDLPEAATKFYELLARWVDVHATDQRDSASIVRRADGGVDLTLFSVENGAAAEPYYRRSFLQTETSELRLFLHGGKDVTVTANAGPAARNNVLLRVIGGAGDDLLVDNAAGGPTRFYDDRGDNRIEGQSSTRIDTREYKAPPPVSHSAQPQDWGARWGYVPALTYSSDLGMLMGVSVARSSFGFRRNPFKSKLTVEGAYATVPSRFKGAISFERQTANPSTTVEFSAAASQIETARFYGLGNDTNDDLPDLSYRMGRTEYRAFTSVNVTVSPRLTYSIGPEFTLFDTDSIVAFTALTGSQPYGAGRFAEAGLRGDIRFDSRDTARAATRGLLLTAEASYHPALLDLTSSYSNARVSGATYLTASALPSFTLALRGTAERVWGEHPFYAAAYLGGRETLRGFREQRFAGDAALLGNAELRVRLGEVFVVIPETVGFHLLADAGRVYLDGASPGGWHSAVGGGVWVSALHRSLLASLSVARSAERTGFYLKGGFLF